MTTPNECSILITITATYFILLYNKSLPKSYKRCWRSKNYKFLDRYVPEEMWNRLMVTYRMDSYTRMWESLEQCMALFREVSAEMAGRSGYLYPSYDEKISSYVDRCKEKYNIKT